MAEENRVKYERVDEKGDEYRCILAKFYSRFLYGPDFEIEFVPLSKSFDLGRIFVSEIDSMNTIDLYRWANRHTCLSKGVDRKRGTILSKDENIPDAKFALDQWRRREFYLEPRQIVSRVKRVYEGVAREFSEPTAFAYNYFLYSGELGSFPLVNEEFSIEELRKFVEEQQYQAENSAGELVERTLAEHLFDTHKTKYVETAILNFLKEMLELRKEIMEKYGEEGK